MEITVWHEQGRVDVTVMAVKGVITIETYEQLEARFDRECEQGTDDLLLDLREVTLHSSSGLRAIHKMFLALEKTDETTRKEITGGKYKSSHLKILSHSKEIVGVLKRAGFDMFLEIYDDLEGAVASF